MKSIQAPGMKTISVFAVLAFVRSWRPLTPFNYTHWLFTYEFGPTKRGLMGELLRVMHLDPTFERVQGISLVLQLVAACILFCVLTTPLRRHPNTPGAGWFTLMAVTSPATLSRLAWDSGRFDALGLILLLCAGMPLVKVTPQLLRMCLVLLVGLLMILIHEAQAFLFVPFFVYLAWREELNSPTPVPACRSLLITLALLIGFALFWTQFAVVDLLPAVYREHLVQKGPLHVQAAEIPLRTIATNLRYHLNLTFRPMVFFHHALFIVGSFWSLRIMFRCMQTLPALRWPTLRLLGPACAFSPLVLYAIGFDHIRWWSFALCNLFIYLTRELQRDVTAKKVFGVCETHHRTLILAVFCALILGSYADYRSFAFYESVIDRWTR